MTTAATHHYAEIGLRYHYVEAGDGPAVLLLHGFPELWYSWRHQVGALASAGYRAIAPDLRGFGESQITAGVRDYSLLQHARDVMSLLDAIGVEQAVVAGHDWGANLTWLLGLAYPERVRAIVSLSIPFYPKPRDPEQMRAWSEGKFDFMRYFQKPGAAEREFAEDPRKFFELFFYGLSGDAPEDTVDTLYLRKPPEAKLLDGFPKPAKLPAWLSEADLAYYVTAYERTGLTPALNFYRNVEQDYPGLKPHYERSLEQPVLFIGGAREAAVRFGNVEGMRAVLPNLRAIHILPDCGHWVQQERPGEVNAALLEFLSPGHPIA